MWSFVSILNKLAPARQCILLFFSWNSYSEVTSLGYQQRTVAREMMTVPPKHKSEKNRKWLAAFWPKFWPQSGGTDHLLSFPHVWCLGNCCAVLEVYLAVGVIIEWGVISVKMSCQSAGSNQNKMSCNSHQAHDVDIMTFYFEWNRNIERITSN